MSVANIILKNTLILLIAQIVSMGLGIVFTVYMARYLGVEGFGLLSFGLAFASAFAIFGDFGLSTLTTREVARARELAGKYLGNIIVIKIIMVILTFCLVILWVNFRGYPEETAKILYLMALSIVFTTFTQTFNSIFQAFERMEYQSLGAILSSVLMLGGALLVIWLDKGVMAFALTYFAANAVVMLYSLAVCSWKFVLPRIQIDTRFWRSMLVSAFPFGLSAAAGIIYSNADSIMLSGIKGYEAVGLYSAAYKLVVVLAVIPSMISVAVFPVMSRFHLSSKASLQRITEKYFKLMLILSLPIGTGTILLSDKIIYAIYGNGYAQSAIVLQILVWAAMFTFIGAAYIQLCGSTDRQLLVAKLSIACMVINLAANLLLIPQFSYMGSAVARLTSETFLVLSILYIMSRIGYGVFRRDIIASAARAIFASLVMGAFLAVFVGLGLIVSILIAIAVYFLTLYAIKGIDKEDIDIFKSVVFRRDVVEK